MNDAVAIARLPAPERMARWKAWQARCDEARRTRLGQTNAMLPLLLLSTMPTLGAAHSRYQAILGSTATLVAAERHRRKAGDWPASVADIDRAILSTPPVDPFSGRPFRMERTDGQLLVYSVGVNGKDERGAYEPDRWDKGSRDDVGTGAWDVAHASSRPGRSSSHLWTESPGVLLGVLLGLSALGGTSITPGETSGIFGPDCCWTTCQASCAMISWPSRVVGS